MIERIIALDGFVTPVLFPFKKDWNGRRVLLVDCGNEQDPGFPGADVRFLDMETALADDTFTGTCDYIAAPGLGTGVHDTREALGRLLAFLTPGGVIAAGFYGYAGYYGLNMLATIVRNFTADIDDFSNANDFARVINVGQAVVAQLPSNHPARKREAFIKQLEKGDKETFLRLLYLSTERVHTVATLRQCIEQCGGRLLDWVLPASYDPARYINDNGIIQPLAALPTPQRWEAAELINAWPFEHYVFVAGKETQPINIPWDSGDLYLWRPVGLPLCRWGELEEETGGIENQELESWQALFCRAAGTATIDELSLNVKKTAAEITAFLKRAVDRRLLALLPPA